MKPMLKKRLFCLLVGLSAWIASFILYAPPFHGWALGLYRGLERRPDLLRQCADPFTRDLTEPILGYRILQPLIAHTLGLCGDPWSLRALLGLPGLNFLAIAVTLAIVCNVCWSRFGRGEAVILTFILATTQLTQWSNIRWGTPDGITFLAIAYLLQNKPKIWSTSLATFLGLLNDERLVLAVPFIILWHLPVEQISTAWSLQQLCSFWPKIKQLSLAIAAGIILYLLLRLAIGSGLIGPGIQTHYSDLLGGTFLRILTPAFYAPWLISVIAGFRWAWLLPCMAIQCQWQKRTIMAVLLGASLAISSVFIICVADVSRSYAFIFPALLISYQWLRQQGSSLILALSAKRLATLVLLANVITPGFMSFGYIAPGDIRWIEIYRPLPWSLLRLNLQKHH